MQHPPESTSWVTNVHDTLALDTRSQSIPVELIPVRIVPGIRSTHGPFSMFQPLPGKSAMTLTINLTYPASVFLTYTIRQSNMTMENSLRMNDCPNNWNLHCFPLPRLMSIRHQRVSLARLGCKCSILNVYIQYIYIYYNIYIYIYGSFLTRVIQFCSF